MSRGPKPTRLVWRPEVRADRINIMEYIAQDSPLAAIELDGADVVILNVLHAARQWPPASDN